MNHQPRQRQTLLIRLLTAVAMFSMSLGLAIPRVLNAAPAKADECRWQ